MLLVQTLGVKVTLQVFNPVLIVNFEIALLRIPFWIPTFVYSLFNNITQLLLTILKIERRTAIMRISPMPWSPGESSASPNIIAKKPSPTPPTRSTEIITL